jgi:hypothetical protein
VSTIRTWNDALPTLPCESVARQVTVVVPSGKTDPEAGEQLTFGIGPSMSSTAVGVEYVTADPCGPFASRWIGPGTLLSTGALSATVTVTVNEPDVLFPWESLALQFTVVVPTGNVEPDAGLQLTATEPSTASLADAEYVTAVPA